jgi:hypothetical protein
MMNSMPEEEEELEEPVKQEPKTDVPSPRYPKSKKLKTN